MDEAHDNVQVVIRVRPLSEEEFPEGSCVAAQMERASVVLQAQPEPKQFTFDFVADEEVTQAQLFTIVGKPICASCLAGYNSTIFAYGQTGAGKTHTILGEIGSEGDKENRGILPRCFESLFASIEQSPDTEYFIKCSFLEIYQEQVFDLLDDSRSFKALHLREDFKLGTYVEDLTEVPVGCAEETFNILSKGNKNRHMGATLMNKESSRSHAVFSLKIDSRQIQDSSVSLRSSRFHLIDLAGSERQKDTEASGQRLKEAGMINKSLSALGNVINGLVLASEGKPRHIHYRDSKLTFLLKDSLGGNSKTCIIANISPAATSYAETLSTLKFAQRAKLIRNKAVVNEICSDKTAQLKSQIARLKAELEDARHSCPLCRGQAIPRELVEVFAPELPSDASTDTVLLTLKQKCRGMTEQAAAGCMKLFYERESKGANLPFEFSAANLGRAQLEALKKCYAEQIETLKSQLSAEQYDEEHREFSKKIDKTLLEVHQQQSELQYNIAEKGLLLEEARLDLARMQQAYEELAAEHAICGHSEPRNELEMSIRQVLQDATEVDQLEVQLSQSQARQAELERELLEIKDQLDNATTARDYFESQLQARMGCSSPVLRDELEKLAGEVQVARKQAETEKTSYQQVFTEYCKVLEELGQTKRKGTNETASSGKVAELNSELQELHAELERVKALNKDLSEESTQAKSSATFMQDELTEAKDCITELEEILKAKEADLERELEEKENLKHELEAATERTVHKLKNELEVANKRIKKIEEERAFEMAFLQQQKDAQLERVNSERKSLMQEVEVLRSVSAFQSRENSAERKQFSNKTCCKENRTPHSIHINICSPSDLHLQLQSGRRSSTRKNSIAQCLDDKDSIIAELRQELLKKDIELKLRQTSMFESELVNMRNKLVANEQELMNIKTRSNSRRMDEDDSEELMQVRNKVFALETELEHSREELRKSFTSREKLLDEVRRRGDAEEAAKLQVKKLRISFESPATTPRGRYERGSVCESASKADTRGKFKRRTDTEGKENCMRQSTEFAELTKTVNQFKEVLGAEFKGMSAAEMQELLLTWKNQLNTSEADKEEISLLRSKVLTLEQELLLEKQKQDLESKRPLTPYSCYNFQSSADSSFRNLLLEL
mmetsp:Transcript_27647/g.49919  ORF Transcript_27647/g.49919 Transcript_27647/m.49919 type:complete len:1136 (-) Transcript_27647:23-3430(-)